MRKKFICVLVVLIYISSIYMMYPLFTEYYGNRVDTIKAAVYIAVLLLSLAFVFGRLNAFIEKEYLFFKSIGEASTNIIKRFLNKQAIFYMLAGTGIYFAAYDVSDYNWNITDISIYGGSIVKSFISVAAFIFFLSLFAILLFFVKHFPRIYKLCCVCVVLLAAALMFKLANDILFGINSSMAAKELVGYVVEVNKDYFLYNFVCGENVVTAVIVLAACVLLIALYKKLDNSIITFEAKKGSSRLQFKIYDFVYNKHYNKRIAVFVRDLFLLFRNKRSIAAYVLVYVLFTFIIQLAGSNIVALSVITDMALSLVSCGIEYLYRADIGSRKWYRVAGAEFSWFIRKKTAVTIFLNAYICVFYIFKAASPENILMICAVILFAAVSIIYWNGYFSSGYIFMKNISAGHEELKTFLAYVLSFIPVVNLFMIHSFYKKARKQWRIYVISRKSDKKI